MTSLFSDQDHQWMQRAIKLAKYAKEKNEIPVGAVLVHDNQLIAEGFNQPIQSKDPTSHAEINVLRKAGLILQNYRLVNTTLYVTLEPCVMCFGAMIHARIKRLVFGAYDTKAGAQSVFNLTGSEQFNHTIQTSGGLLAEPCGLLLSEFFKAKRLALTSEKFPK